MYASWKPSCTFCAKSWSWTWIIEPWRSEVSVLCVARTRIANEPIVTRLSWGGSLRAGTGNSAADGQPADACHLIGRWRLLGQAASGTSRSGCSAVGCWMLRGQGASGRGDGCVVAGGAGDPTACDAPASGRWPSGMPPATLRELHRGTTDRLTHPRLHRRRPDRRRPHQHRGGDPPQGLRHDEPNYRLGNAAACFRR